MPALAAPSRAFAEQSKKGVAEARELTKKLDALNANYRVSKAPQKASALDEMVGVAREREALLVALTAEDPPAVAGVLLPEEKRRGFPRKVQRYLEEQIDAEGTLEVAIEDREQEARVLYALETAERRLSLHFAADPPEHLLTGARIRVRGTHVGKALMSPSGDTGVETLALDSDDAGSATSSSSAIVPNTFGEQRTVVILVNFQDKPTDQPWTLEYVDELVFGTTSDFFLENSYRQTWLAGEVHGWYTLPIPSTQCDQYGIAREAKSAAMAAGVDLSGYDRILYAFPKNSCTWSGLSTVGGSPSESWVHNDFVLRVVAHELGHGLGLFHSQGLDCTPGTLGSDCRKLAYGDSLDVMGGREGHLNAFQKERLGWLSADSPQFATIETSGTYVLDPYELVPNALKILKSTDPVTGSKSWYYLEYRQALGFDAWILGDWFVDDENVLHGVVLHLGNDSLGDSSLLLDMTPDSPSTYGDLFDPALATGQSYSDPESGVTITTAWADGSGAAASVSFAQPTCVHTDPSVALTPAESQWVAAGSSVAYGVIVTDRDPAACGTSAFQLAATVPSGWTASFGEAALNLGPGASASTTLTVTSPRSASAGFHDVVVSAENGADPESRASATAIYVVSAKTNQSPGRPKGGKK